MSEDSRAAWKGNGNSGSERQAFAMLGGKGKRQEGLMGRFNGPKSIEAHIFRSPRQSGHPVKIVNKYACVDFHCNRKSGI
jgi:hypothetical protein